eukprot:CAMPEP_0203637930 /NCGR_PEP_ID=MMETSP0088-20131115/4109_1 /ASSEMBLY_ACC=CAM_ASM_001087 /TAXON_ID=426623 /ORGANISM="Chaetoceros affinis, Strain CCMP159" /LENGTH=211 /DNA_ID=CAMNT_0050492475 /DNA_START=123 /DNA_END=758 /DNA_ORIENTATION=-
MIKTLFILSFFIQAAIVQSLTCEDDRYWNFFQLENSQLVTYYCADVGKNFRNRKRFCETTIGDTLVKEKCPNACRACPSGEAGCMDGYPLGWVDSRGNGCDWYARFTSFRCERGEEYLNHFRTAKQVCCVCGGGCANWPQGWHDSDGSGFTCDWYAGKKGRCQADGESFENRGFTANKACCACGGGFEQRGGSSSSLTAEDPENEDSNASA